jgi:hypothetical protein
VKEKQRVTIGDIAYFFECGGLNHICAKGEIKSIPAKIDKSDCEKKCLKNVFEKELRVKVEILMILEKPKPIKDLQGITNNGILKYIIDNHKSCPGSTFRLNEQEANVLHNIFAELIK